MPGRLKHNPIFRAIDAAARDGKGHLLEDARGHLHAGFWKDDAWRYSSGQPIGHPIARYAVREASGDLQVAA